MRQQQSIYVRSQLHPQSPNKFRVVVHAWWIFHYQSKEFHAEDNSCSLFTLDIENPVPFLKHNMDYKYLCKLKTAIAEEITRNPVVKSLAHLFTLIWKCEDNSLLLRTYHSQCVQEGRSSKPGNFCGKTLLQSASCTYELIAITGDSDHFHVLAMNKIMMHYSREGWK